MCDAAIFQKVTLNILPSNWRFFLTKNRHRYLPVSNFFEIENNFFPPSRKICFEYVTNELNTCSKSLSSRLDPFTPDDNTVVQLQVMRLVRLHGRCNN